jgi:DNA-directed RNA polymerase specialized sigma subunit, sigma24 homolog
MSENDRQLLTRARKGDVEAFEKLAENYHKKVYNIILNKYENRKEVSNLTQEVFVRIFKTLDELQDDSHFALSIYKTTKEVCGL